jgi:hypothetical protein
MKSRTSLWIRFVPLLLAAAGIAGYAPVASASLTVTNYGTDSSSCGSTTSPCRSISQAIENAASGDTIWVGAGHYGDLNGDGNFDAPGSEHATVFTQGFDYDACVVCIVKTVKIYSYNGAAETTIQVGPNAISPTTVFIAANNAVFGAVGHGFTITGGNTSGVVIDLERGGGAFGGVTVSGNIDLKDGTGFTVDGPQGAVTLPNACGPDPCPKFFGVILLSGNQAIGSGTGFFVEPKLGAAGYQGPLPFLLQDNLAVGTGTGFVVDPGSVECDDCFDAGRAQVVTIVHNFATDGGIGFNLLSTGMVSDNVATNNSAFGFMITDVPMFVRNQAIGNAGPGAVVGFLLPVYPGPLSVVTMRQNNFYGNDRNRPPLSFGFMSNPGGPSAHCGVLNVGAIGFSDEFGGGNGPPTTPLIANIQAADNFWGSARGPQPNGPADAGGGVCDENGGVTAVTPFATSPISIAPLP